jgi:hypothetical protein
MVAERPSGSRRMPLAARLVRPISSRSRLAACGLPRLHGRVFRLEQLRRGRDGILWRREPKIEDLVQLLAIDRHRLERTSTAELIEHLKDAVASRHLAEVQALRPREVGR